MYLNFFYIWILYLRGNWYIKCHQNIGRQDEGQTESLKTNRPMITHVLLYVP